MDLPDEYQLIDCVVQTGFPNILLMPISAMISCVVCFDSAARYCAVMGYRIKYRFDKIKAQVTQR
jgi:hypothetical protein